MPDVRAFAELLAARRSIYLYQTTHVPPALLRWALDAAVLGPNHYRTRPWRFHVFTAAGRDKLADAYAASALRLGRDTARARTRAFEAPAMIAVSCVPDFGNPKVKVHEEEFATAAAIENLMLALAAAGVGSIWTTGELITGPEMAEVLSLREPHSKVLGIIYAGYADKGRQLPPREPIDHTRFTTWIDG
jgi:nitroreductase